MNKTHGRVFFQTRSAAELFYSAIPMASYIVAYSSKRATRVKNFCTVVDGGQSWFVVSWWINEN